MNEPDIYESKIRSTHSTDLRMELLQQVSEELPPLRVWRVEVPCYYWAYVAARSAWIALNLLAEDILEESNLTLRALEEDELGAIEVEDGERVTTLAVALEEIKARSHCTGAVISCSEGD